MTDVQQQTPRSDAGSGRKRQRPCLAVTPESERAPKDVIEYFTQRAEATASWQARLNSVEQTLRAEQADKRTLQAEVTSLQVNVLAGWTAAGRWTGCEVTSLLAVQAEQTSQQELRETLQRQQLALRAEHDAAIAREVSRTSSAYSLLRKAEAERVRAWPLW